MIYVYIKVFFPVQVVDYLSSQKFVHHFIEHNLFEPEKFLRKFELIWVTETLGTNFGKI